MRDPIEMRVDRALRETPLRRAPASLESRVLREIGRRASLPWWQRSFARWPGIARAGFLLACAAIAAAVLLAWPWGPDMVRAGSWVDGGRLLPWASSALTLVDVFRALDAAVGRTIPNGWLYGAAAVGVFLYASLFVLGATAYRTLYLHPSSAGDRS
jgi:hypothetical protein